MGLSHILCEREGSRRFPSNRVKRNKAEMISQGKGWQDLDKKGGLQDRPQKKMNGSSWGYEVDKHPSKKDDRQASIKEGWQAGIHGKHPSKKDDRQASIKEGWQASIHQRRMTGPVRDEGNEEWRVIHGRRMTASPASQISFFQFSRACGIPQIIFVFHKC